jgi:F-type H+-transporting ATPase subunit epsilon
MTEASLDKIKLEIVTPERIVVAEDVDEVVLPGIDGEFGVLQGHIPFLTALKVGVLTYKSDGAEEHLAVSWGYVEVTADNVKVLAETAEKATEIDLSRAKVAKEAAEKILTTGKKDAEYGEAQVRLEKAIIRVQVAGKK